MNVNNIFWNAENAPVGKDFTMTHDITTTPDDDVLKLDFRFRFSDSRAKRFMITLRIENFAKRES
jgi:hypothetical protein